MTTITVEFLGLEPITATVRAADLGKDFCTVTVLENPNDRLDMGRGTKMVVPRAILGESRICRPTIGAARGAVHGL